MVVSDSQGGTQLEPDDDETEIEGPESQPERQTERQTEMQPVRVLREPPELLNLAWCRNGCSVCRYSHGGCPKCRPEIVPGELPAEAERVLREFIAAVGFEAQTAGEAQMEESQMEESQRP